MHTILVAVQDRALSDQIRMAIKTFDGIHAVAVPREQVLSLVQDKKVAEALIVEHMRTRTAQDVFLADIRKVNSEIALMAVGDLPNRNHFNKVKLELDIFSFIPLPLEPFDLVRRLHRLVDSFQPASSS